MTPAAPDAEPEKRWPFLLLVTLFASAGLGLIAASLVDYEYVRAKTDRFSSTGRAEFVTPEFFAGMVGRLRVIGVALGALVLPLFLFRRPIGRFPARLGASTRELWADLRSFEVRGPGRLGMAALAGVVIAGIGVRLGFVDQPLRFDEGWTFNSFVQMPAHYIPLRYNVPNNHVAHTLLVKLSTAIFGNEEWAIRLPAAFFGVLLIPLTFFLFRLLYSEGAGLIAAALVAGSSYLVQYSTNGRGYTLVVCAFLGMLLAGTYALRRRSLAGWAILVLLGVLGAYTIPIMMLPAAITFLWLGEQAWTDAGEHPRSRLLADVVTAGSVTAILTAILYAPVLAINGWGSLTSNSGVQSETAWSQLVADAPAFVRDVAHLWTRDAGSVLAWATLVGAVLALVLHRRIALIRAPLFLAVPPVLLLYLLAVPDLGYPRVWIFLLPLYLGFAAAGLSRLLTLIAEATGLGERRGGILTAGAAVLLAVASGAGVARSGTILASDETGIFPLCERAVEELGRAARPGDLVYTFYACETQLVYYGRREGLLLKAADTVEHHRFLRVLAVPTGETEPNTPRRLFFVLNTSQDFHPLEEMQRRIPADRYAIESAPVELVHEGTLQIWVAPLAGE